MSHSAFLKSLHLVAISICLLVGNVFCAEEITKKNHKVQESCASTVTFTLWQLPTQTGEQLNSYVMQTVNGKVIVIDGGQSGDAGYLKGFLAALGNHVDIWFISHQHYDHISALVEILNKPGNLTIDKIYASLLDEKWVEVNENAWLGDTVKLNETLVAAKKQVIELAAGQMLEIDGVKIEILCVKNPEIINNGINNSSVVMRVWDAQKSVLFTGDLGVEGGQKLLKGPYRQRLKADYVQMAHHGQDGVDEDFYTAVGAKYCIWPTPIWLWHIDKTLEVRAWMDKLNVQKHYLQFEGLQKVN
jgi:beta-lactamase superfamily II metal-dependent hydrolase